MVNLRRIVLDRLPKQRSVQAIVSVLGSVSLVTGLIQFSGAFQLLDWAILDQSFRLRKERKDPANPTANPVVIVTIAEEDIQRWGHPLKDSQLAILLSRIQAEKPRVIGLDLYRNLPVPPGQGALDKVFRASPIVIGIKRIAGEAQSAQVPPMPVLQANGQIAASDIVLDTDGKIRRALISLKDRSDKTYYTLGTRLALEYLAKENITVQPLNQNQVQLGKAIFRPLTENGSGYVRADTGGYQILSNFYPMTHRPIAVSMTAVLTQTVPPGLLQDKIVLIGTTASSLGDRFYVPYSDSPQTSWAGVEVHGDLAAQLVEAAQGKRLTLQALSWEWSLGWMVCWATLGTVLGWVCQGRWMLGLSVGAGWMSLMGMGYGAFVMGWWVPMMAAAVALLGGSVFGYGTRLWSALQLSHGQLESYSRTLESTVQLRTLELQEKNQALEFSFQQAEMANRSKSAFLASMNHEFRTPLTIILGSSELMQQSEALQPQQQSYLNSIDRSVSHLLELINDVLDLSRLEANKVEYQPTPLPLLDLITTLSQLFRTQAEAKGIAFELVMATALPKVIETDERKLRQILINLLGNAIKFTRRGQVLLTVSLMGNSLRFRVADTGCGIAPEECDRIFVPFYQSRSQPSGAPLIEGTGLGLAISQQFAQILGGTLTVQSTLGVGSIFQVTLPLRIPQDEAPDRVQLWEASEASKASEHFENQTFEDQVSPKSEPWLKALKTIPVDWRDRFLQSVTRLNGDRAQFLLMELDPEYLELKQYLTQAIEAFQFDEIQRLLQRSLAPEPEPNGLQVTNPKK
jgi:adenylate cyclase